MATLQQNINHMLILFSPSQSIIFPTICNKTKEIKHFLFYIYITNRRNQTC